MQTTVTVPRDRLGSREGERITIPAGWYPRSHAALTVERVFVPRQLGRVEGACGECLVYVRVLAVAGADL